MSLLSKKGPWWEPSLPRKTNYYFQWCKVLNADLCANRQLHRLWQQFGSPTRLLCIDSYMSALCILSHRSGITETRTTMKRFSDLLIYRVNWFPPHSTKSYKTTMVAPYHQWVPICPNVQNPSLQDLTMSKHKPSNLFFVDRTTFKFLCWTSEWKNITNFQSTFYWRLV